MLQEGMVKPAVLVTGGATRIGAEIVRHFAAAGWHCVIHYFGSDDEAEALAQSLPSAETIQCDLNDGGKAKAMVEELASRLDNWRVLINSASVFSPDDVTALDPATNRQAMQVNAVTPTIMAQAFLAKAKAQGGRCVIQITDQKIENPNPDFFSYTMSKHALAATIPMLAMGAAGPEDRVYGLAPGAILASHDQSEEETEISHRLNLLGRKTGAEEVAQAALFLASGKLRSGETLFIDSGQHLLDQDRDVIYLAREMQDAS
ncbi:NAD(P)-dependent dehydrogenase, short-chain alcohol dehydrogenase family [Altererythrobacter xiamenensis]|uniref:NAD(P)-dependent dehydrogenase, short-chain alcohol dehydrogenase family n=2 Tax=Altererythrobacter xiamenensis TaxID=1316679 RepID=A0A1Y6E5Z9_9SPHN|nr:NAD(P)-dependent dehydrogenase, short-chain alcohol dehydrogenase family [Altererythrobacter xiamenensis]